MWLLTNVVTDVMLLCSCLVYQRRLRLTTQCLQNTKKWEKLYSKQTCAACRSLSSWLAISSRKTYSTRPSSQSWITCSTYEPVPSFETSGPSCTSLTRKTWWTCITEQWQLHSVTRWLPEDVIDFYHQTSTVTLNLQWRYQEDLVDLYWTVVQTVLTATYYSHRNRRISIPTKSIPRNRSTKNSAQLMTSTKGPPVPNFV